MMEGANIYDAWLDEDGPAALVIREHLMPVEGHDGVLFPPTFASGKDFPGGYNIDEFTDGTNICLIDSVGSQANRIEPIFAKAPYKELVPQIEIKAGEKKVNLVEAGHRAGDAIARCSPLQKELQDAFKAILDGNAEPLAKIGPTSLVFGAWDSRDTQAKLPRLIASTIRAFNVRRLTRSAQYVPATDYVNSGLLEEPADTKTKDAYAERGFVHVPSTGTPGGVIATGGIRRDATLHLAALRLLRAGDDPNRTSLLRQYVLGLALTAFTYPSAGYLRQGCNLVLDPDRPTEFVQVCRDGKRNPVFIRPEDALSYAKAAAQAFGLGENRAVSFDAELAKADVATDAKPKKTRGKKAQQ
jgi:CRISPR-associated protein Csb1